jgi:hypothetical protein
MIYDSPKQPKKRSQVAKRLLSPKTTICGIVMLIIGGIMAYVKLEPIIYLPIISGGLVFLGLKDK